MASSSNKHIDLLFFCKMFLLSAFISLKQDNNQLKQKLNETHQKYKEEDKEASYDALDAENRRNVAKINELKHLNHRLEQDAKRAVCQKGSMRANS